VSDRASRWMALWREEAQCSRITTAVLGDEGELAGPVSEPPPAAAALGTDLQRSTRRAPKRLSTRVDHAKWAEWALEANNKSSDFPWHKREHFAEWVTRMPKADCEAWVRAALAKCERHAITTEPEAAQLILMFLVLGLDADESKPWVQEILTDRELLPIGKLRKLIRLAREQGIDQVDDVVVYGHMEE